MNIINAKMVIRYMYENWFWYEIKSNDNMPIGFFDYLFDDEQRQLDLEAFEYDCPHEGLYVIEIVFEYDPGEWSVGILDGWQIKDVTSAIMMNDEYY